MSVTTEYEVHVPNIWVMGELRMHDCAEFVRVG